MKFENLYINTRDVVDRSLRSLWAGNPGNESQEATAKEIREITKHIFACEDAMPVVQCMNSYESVHSVPGPEAESLVNGLWSIISPQGPKHFTPFEHQYQCWKTLLTEKTPEGKPMSICVTTGTGSGKTECFMLPLVSDLKSEGSDPESVKAIFLYPLNALMEDQKERLEQLLEGTDLTYTVYNGDLPESEPKPNQHDPEHERIRRKISELRGEYTDANGNTAYRFPKMIYTREMVRQSPPDIVLTNPTMLEYILLRKKDESLINPDLKSLRWVAIDETHSYTGAGAAELAMLLRRVCLAFNVSPSDIRYATSSATFANAKSADEKAKAEEALKKFISGITGTSTDQIRVVDGQRIGTIPEGPDHDRWQKIFDNDYVSLKEVFPEGTIDEKLRALDDMCERQTQKPEMKVKVHFFSRVPNNGFHIKLTEHTDGAFKIYTQNGLAQQGEPRVPMLELCRCRTCGEYVAPARVNMKDGTYEPLIADDSDIFDLEEAAVEGLASTDAQLKTIIFGLAKGAGRRGDNNQPFRIDPADPTRLIPTGDMAEWHLVGNTHGSCPYCNCKQTRKQVSDKEDENSLQLDDNEMKLHKFRSSPDFISRLIAHEVLDELDKHDNGKETQLHHGQQYLSFADSRQMAAKSTMNQNLHQERLWFYSTVFHELCKRKANQDGVQAQIKALRRLKDQAEDAGDDDEYDRLDDEIKKLRRSTKETLTWMEIADMLLQDPLCELFCRQFLKKSQANSEIELDGSISRATLEHYVHSIMVMYLAGHPVLASSPETLGLFHPVYPKLSRIELPQEVIDFNENIDNPELKITKDDWQTLLRYFLDYSVRQTESVYLKIADNKPIDILTTNRFQATKPRRRPAYKPTFERGKESASRIIRFVADLYGRDKGIHLNGEAQKQGYDVIAPVIDALWRDLTEGESPILNHGEIWHTQDNCFVKERIVDDVTPIRLNLTEMSFKLYDEAWLCDVNSERAQKHTVALRPVSYSFKGYAPFLERSTPILLDSNLHESWTPYPYYKDSGEEADDSTLEQWASENRKLLWNNNIWGKDGEFAERLRSVYLTPDLLIQAEHTAQVDKSIARMRQLSFKDHEINILACSTTMEMGVNLGSLEAVMLSSVPPQPANYKQRAGRSGRNDKVKSVCITLCGSDAIGLRTYFDPINKIINRPVEVPTIDLMSPQVIQRHVNSFLVRWFGVFGEGNINQKVANYYTHFITFRENGYVKVKNKLNRTMDAGDELGDAADTLYDQFNKKCEECKVSIPADLTVTLGELLKGTCYEGQLGLVIDNANKANIRCYEELSVQCRDLKFALVGNGAIPEEYRKFINMRYSDLLDDRLLSYWATHRFTPNANMPVNVLQFELRYGGSKDKRTDASSSNPSYSLREALSQYVPGNSVVVDGVVYMVRGLECSNMFERIKTFKKIYRSSDKVVISHAPLPDSIRWEVNKEEALELISPVTFLPDTNESTRIMDSSVFTRVSAQLIGTNDWDSIMSDKHLFSSRDNRESGDAKILYYNEGNGFGYAYCTHCGRTVLESEPACDSAHPNLPPQEMNPLYPKIEGQAKYHYALSGKHVGRKCESHKNYSKAFRRNVIIGDLIQTDYSEIRLRHHDQSHWISNRDAEYNLLITLGIVFTQSLAEALGKERSSVDFALTPTGHICIFDTNPGGAGYANQLRKLDLMLDVIKRSKQLLMEAKAKKSNDLLLDKFTLRHLRYIDIDAALAWIEDEEAFSK